MESKLKEKNIRKFTEFTINSKEPIREAFKKQCFFEEKFIIAVDDDDKVVGVVTDGDFRRAIWNSISLEDPLDLIVNRKFVSFENNYDENEIKNVFRTTNIIQIPILENGRLVNIIYEKDIATKEGVKTKLPIDVPVVIMAGGVGARLDPFTKILPKPLIPIREKPVIEIIVDKFVENGVNEFYVTVNHKAKMIKAFFEEIDREYNISYIEEDEPLGTAGSLKLLENKLTAPFIVSNCDIIIEEDYSELLKFHNNGNYALTLVGSMQHHIIPYGVCQIRNGGELFEIKEKPEYDFLVNTGMYVINPEVLKFIPEKKKYDVTDLIEDIKKENMKIGVFPISERSWIDVGQWEEYKKAVDKFKLFE